jgi:hypothetical protein
MFNKDRLPHYPQYKEPHYPLSRRLDGPRSRFGRFGVGCLLNILVNQQVTNKRTLRAYRPV